MPAPGDLSTGSGESDPALTGKEWIRNTDLSRTKNSDVWIRYGRGRLHPPRRVLIARSLAKAADGSRWTLLGFRAHDRSVAAPGWVRDKYGAVLRGDPVLVDNEGAGKLLAPWS